MDNQTQTPSDPNNTLSPSDLVSLYSQQWEQIRHLDSIDFRMMALLPIVVGVLTLGIRFLDGTNPEISKSLLLVVAVIIIGISFAGCYATFRNWLCYMRRFSILNALEREMGMVESHIIKESIQFSFPKGYKGFNKMFMKSARFPLTILYSSLGGCSVILYNGEIACIILIKAFFIALSIYGYSNFTVVS